MGKNDKKRRELLNILHNISQDIGMEFRIQKYAKISIIKGRIKPTSNIRLDTSTNLQDFEGDEL